MSGPVEIQLHPSTDLGRITHRAIQTYANGCDCTEPLAGVIRLLFGIWRHDPHECKEGSAVAGGGAEVSGKRRSERSRARRDDLTSSPSGRHT